MSGTQVKPHQEALITIPISAPGSAALQQLTLTDALCYAMKIHQAGRLREAESIYQRVLRVQPNNPDALQLLGLLADNVGKFDLAEKLMRQSLSYQPNQTGVWSNLGFVLWKLNKLEESEECCREALRLDPDSAIAHVNLGNALKDQGKAEEAIASYQKAIDLNSELGLNNLGNLLKDLGRPMEAIAYYKRAIEARPDYITTHNNLGVALVEQGKIPDAIDSYQRALEIKPDYALAHRNLAFVKKYKNRDQQLETMEGLLENSMASDEDRMFLSFALGKAYEDLKLHEKSFCYMQEGNRLKRRMLDFDIGRICGLYEKVKTIFAKELFDEFSGSGIQDPTPIFILGMPRSGSTLFEQILASHPDVHGAGELDDLHMVVEILNCESTQSHYPNAVTNLPLGQFAVLGRNYLDRIRLHSSTTRFITDKMPRNFEYIGMIKLMLPSAKVIHCKRDPMDTCFSIYKKFFAGIHPYAYDKQELGKYYLLYEELMAHWHDTLPGFIFEIQYEDLVADQETRTRRLLDFCGLDWRDSCLDFFKTERPVQTASAAQVRQPIYKTSVKAWKNYEPYLQPLIEVLQSHSTKTEQKVLNQTDS